MINNTITGLDISHEIRKNKLLKSEKSNNNIDSINYNKKKTEIKCEKNDFDFSKNMKMNGSKIQHLIVLKIHQLLKEK